MSNKLGDFVREYNYRDLGIFYLRGLTVGEYMDLSDGGFLYDKTIGNNIFIKIALSCIVGWEELYYEEDGRYLEYEYSEENKEYLESEWLIEIGQYAYYNLSTITEEELNYLKGYVRFMHYLSDDKNKEKSKYFECETCVQFNAYAAKKCGRSTEEIEAIKKKLGKVDSNGESKNDVVDKLNKYKRSKNRSSTNKKSKPKETTLYLEKFDFPECPVSWIPKHLQDWGSRLFHCDKNDVLFFSGGLKDQQNRIFEMQRLITSESNIIEGEKMKEDMKNNKNK
ncbi:MAG: hypothetical protein CL489_10960 [Acidobacteria bacterium]|nr:hypothetical protein [Acidobacteriota bacterium]